MEHHAMIALHHEDINPPQHQHLADYPSNSAVTAWQPGNVGKGVSHARGSESLANRYPYPANAVYDPLEPSVAYGRNGVPKTVMVRRTPHFDLTHCVFGSRFAVVNSPTNPSTLPLLLLI